MRSTWLIIAIAFAACNQSKQGTSVNSRDSIVTPTPVERLDTVTSIDAVPPGGVAIFKAPNGAYYKVTGDSVTVDTLLSNITPFDTRAATADRACNSENFQGVARKAAKTKVATGTLKQFDNLAELLQFIEQKEATLTDELADIGDDSPRQPFEKYRITVDRAWLYTFKRLADEDYHLIVGTTNDKATATFFGIEVSAPPSTSGVSRTKIIAARKQFREIFGITDNCYGNYIAWLQDTPMEVKFSGSLFYDHRHDGGGPAYAKAETSWEVHPVTAIQPIPIQ
jgi:hypothetical protein